MSQALAVAVGVMWHQQHAHAVKAYGSRLPKLRGKQRAALQIVCVCKTPCLWYQTQVSKTVCCAVVGIHLPILFW
jgi:hypothetical protein